MQASAIGAAVLSLAADVTEATHGAIERETGKSSKSHGILDPEDADLERVERDAKKIRQLQTKIQDYQHFLGAIAEVEQQSKKGLHGFINRKWVHGLEIPNLFNKQHLLNDLAIVFDPFQCEFAVLNRVMLYQDDYDEIDLPYYNFPFDVITIFGDTVEDCQQMSGAKTESRWKYMAKARSKPYKRGEKSAREQVYTYPLVGLGKTVILQRLFHKISTLHILKTKPSRWQNEAYELHGSIRTPKPNHEEAGSNKYHTEEGEKGLALRCVAVRMMRNVLLTGEMTKPTQSPEDFGIIANQAPKHVPRELLNKSLLGHREKRSEGLYYEALEVLAELIASDEEVQGAAHHLLDVVKKRETPVTRGILKPDEHPSTPDSQIALELRYASQRGMAAIVENLLASPRHKDNFSWCRDIDQNSNAGYTCLSLAASEGHVEVVKKLLKYPLDLSLRNHHGRTALSLAAGNDHSDTVKVLVKHEPESGPPVDVNAEDWSGRTPLSWAVTIPCRDDCSVVESLLAHGASPRAPDKTGRTPLSWAAQFGDEKAVLMLLKHSAKPDPPDTVNGRTPLWWAAGSGHSEIVDHLRKAGAQLDTSDKFGRTPLSWAAANGHTTVVNFLLKNTGVTVDSRDTKYGRTPISWAAEAGYDVIVEALIEGGADPNIPSFPQGSALIGRPPLSFAAAQGHLEVVKCLLARRAVVDPPYGQTSAEASKQAATSSEGSHLGSSTDRIFARAPLSWAAGNGYDKVVGALIDAGSNLNIADTFGRTALWYAARNGHGPVVVLLLDKGADPLIKDFKGASASDQGYLMEHIDVVKAMQEQEARAVSPLREQPLSNINLIYSLARRARWARRTRDQEQDLEHGPE
ncbi:hypothetical protein NUW58_g1545 [Xylaria curta]|uniref:Uncharacterized protein n=1 Tax=Xylaria curta TaxID=42375 RepID=A0ACC1PMA0_9PEZI|nr:hypothetical protein NUW58_g1545 [Xylaria curta]